MAAKKESSSSGAYRRPPAEHQFKKGQSGNPNGRPRKKPANASVPGLGGGIQDMLQAVVLSEASRPISVREGDKVTEMSAMQALIRSNFRLAAQGNANASRHLLEMVARMETSRVEYAKAMLDQVAEHKSKYGPLFEQHEREGRDPPDIYPHPDDIIVNMTTGEITIDGPMDLEQAGAQKAFLQIAVENWGRFFEVEAGLKKNRKNRALRKEFDELKKYDEFIRKMGDRRLRLEALRLAREALKNDQSKQKSKRTNRKTVPNGK